MAHHRGRYTPPQFLGCGCENGALVAGRVDPSSYISRRLTWCFSWQLIATDHAGCLLIHHLVAAGTKQVWLSHPTPPSSSLAAYPKCSSTLSLPSALSEATKHAAGPTGGGLAGAARGTPGHEAVRSCAQGCGVAEEWPHLPLIADRIHPRNGYIQGVPL